MSGDESFPRTADDSVSIGSEFNPTEEITTNKITDGTDGSAWETLRAMGFESGDYIALDSFTFPSTYSTSNTSFLNVTPGDDRWYPITDGYPTGADLAVRFVGRLSCDTGGETASALLTVGQSTICDSDIQLDVTGTTATVDSGRATIIDQSVDTDVRIDMKTTAGTASFDQRPRVIVEAKIP